MWRPAGLRVQHVVGALQDGRQAEEGARGDPPHPAPIRPTGPAQSPHQVTNTVKCTNML